MSSATVRVMIVDDHRIVREGLRQVVADAAHGAQALQVLHIVFGVGPLVRT